MRFARRGRRAVLAAALLAGAALAQDRAQLCAACHGSDGNSTTAGVPSIAGQPEAFIELQLILYREGLRASAQMAPMAQGLSDAEVRALARHFAALPARPMAFTATDERLVARGAEVSQAKRCGVCHLRDYSGQAQVPRLAGQREEYLDEQLRAYRDGKRVGGDTSMNEAMYGVSDADIKALAHFLARSSSQPGAAPAPARSARKGPSAAPK